MTRRFRSFAGGTLLARCLLLGAALTTSLAASCTRTSTAAPRVYRATGVVRSFGPERADVNIAHDDIQGYMAAMTMSFVPSSSSQIEGLRVNDRISFEFFETEDARRMLTRVEKQ